MADPTVYDLVQTNSVHSNWNNSTEVLLLLHLLLFAILSSNYVDLIHLERDDPQRGQDEEAIGLGQWKNITLQYNMEIRKRVRDIRCLELQIDLSPSLFPTIRNRIDI